MSDVKIDLEDSKLKVGLDLDQDQKSSISLNLDLREGLEEAMAAFSRGEDVDPIILENKVVSFKFENGSLLLHVDSDRDGESLLFLKVDLMETADEVMQEVKN